MSDDEIRRLAEAIAERMPPHEGGCFHGITHRQAGDLKAFADFWRDAKRKAASSAVGFVMTVLLLAILAGFGIAAKGMLGK